jgi:hypothetical protein
MITQARFKELLDYDPSVGVFIRKVAIKQCKVGDVAGSVDSKGYLVITIDGSRYKAHRLAWFYVYGVWPKGQIDHKDTIKHHNWIENLRDVTHSGNQQNQIKASCRNITGFLGVTFNKQAARFVAQIKSDGKKKHIGYFDSAEEAHNAYLIAKRELHLTCTI